MWLMMRKLFRFLNTAIVWSWRLRHIATILCLISTLHRQAKGRWWLTWLNERREQPLPEACLAVWRYQGHSFNMIYQYQPSNHWIPGGKNFFFGLLIYSPPRGDDAQGGWQTDKSYSQRRCWCICRSRAYHAKHFRPDTSPFTATQLAQL